MSALATLRTVLPQDKQPALRVMPMPADLNPGGDVFGGWVMSMADIAGAIPAVRRARSRVTTVAVNSFTFEPLAKGALRGGFFAAGGKGGGCGRPFLA